MKQHLCCSSCLWDVGIAHSLLAEEGRWSHLILRLGGECPGLQGFPGGRREPPLHNPQGWPAGLGKNIFPPYHLKRCTKAYTCYKAHLTGATEWLWPWHSLSLNGSDDAFSGMLGPIICTQSNIHPLIRWQVWSTWAKQGPWNSFCSEAEFKAEFKTADPENWS